MTRSANVNVSFVKKRLIMQQIDDIALFLAQNA